MIVFYRFYFSVCCILTLLMSCSTPQIEKNQEKAYLYLQMGVSHLNSNHLNEAIVALQNAKQLNPELAEADNHLGLALLLQKRFNLAEQSFQSALQKQPSLAEAHNNLCALYLEMNQPDSAIAQCGLALSSPSYTNPATAEANIAKAYLLKKDYAQMLSHSQNAININPQNCLALKLNGEALMYQRQLSQSRSMLEKSIHHCPQWAEPYFLIAQSFIKEGSRHLAQETLHEITEIFEDADVKSKAQKMLSSL